MKTFNFEHQNALQLIIRQAVLNHHGLNLLTIFDMIFGLNNYQKNISDTEIKKMLCEYHNQFNENEEDNIYVGMKFDNNINGGKFYPVKEVIVGKEGSNVYAFTNYQANPSHTHGAMINCGVEYAKKYDSGYEKYFEIIK